MLNEGIVTGDTAAALRSEMVRQLHNLGEATSDRWERAVFEALTGHTREDVDWDVEDNHAGYYTWIKSFDQLAHELVEDGFAATDDVDGTPVFRPVDTDPNVAWSQQGHPPQN